jgi:Uma2 family endonuclease
MYARSGASYAHSLITTHISGHLWQQLRGGPCEVHQCDLRVKIASAAAYYYPVVVVVCGGAQFEDHHTDSVLKPRVIVEVLSPSTEPDDRVRKLRRDLRIGSLEEYLLVARDEMYVEHLVRAEGGNRQLRVLESPDDLLGFPSIGCRMTIREIYERVEPGAQEAPLHGAAARKGLQLGQKKACAFVVGRANALFAVSKTPA